MRPSSRDLSGPSARWERTRQVACTGVALLALWAAGDAGAQSFTLDDSPAAPAVGGVGPIPGCGAENQFGLAAGPCPTGLAPSPTLSTLSPLQGSGSILAPGPSVMLSPNGQSLDALSSRHEELRGGPYRLLFSVDRLSVGQAGSAVAVQAGLNQQPADLFAGASFADPRDFVGRLGAGPFAGTLPALLSVNPSNVLSVDDSLYGLVSGAGVVPPSASAPAIGSATHDNLDAYDDTTFDADGDGLFDVFAYFSLNPDEALLVGRSPADLFDVAPNTAAGTPTPFATAASMGLDSGGVGGDSIDALALFDRGALGGPGNGGPGGQAGVDYALFSLAPGSASLTAFQLSAADVFFTDFSGAFAVYATAADLGLQGGAGGAPGAGDNVDALELREVPALSAAGLAALAMALAFTGARGFGRAVDNPPARSRLPSPGPGGFRGP